MHNRITINVAAPTPAASLAVSLYTMRVSHMTYAMTNKTAPRKIPTGGIVMAADII